LSVSYGGKLVNGYQYLIKRYLQHQLSGIQFIARPGNASYDCAITTKNRTETNKQAKVMAAEIDNAVTGCIHNFSPIT